jgi:2-oxo-3-hexenedioate decarboxylase
VASVAAELLRCEDEHVDRPPFTDEWPDLDLDTGYRVQDLNLSKRLERGERLVGVKLRDFRFKAGDVAADNASSAAFVTGPVGRPPSELDLSLEAVLVEVDGVVVDSATGAAVQGHPGEALALAANELARRGLALEPDWIVLTGGMTDAVFAPPGVSVAMHFTHLGSVFLNGGEG